MMDAEWFAEVARRRQEIRKEEGLPCDDPNIASGVDLDACGSVVGLERKQPHEYDSEYRARILNEIEKRSRKL